MSSRMFSQQSSIGLNHLHRRLHRHCRSIDHLTQSILSMFKILFLSKITKRSFQKNPIQIAHPTTSIYSFLRMKKLNLTLLTLWFILLRNQIRSEQISLFEAAFQGKNIFVLISPSNLLFDCDALLPLIIKLNRSEFFPDH